MNTAIFRFLSWEIRMRKANFINIDSERLNIIHSIKLFWKWEYDQIILYTWWIRIFSLYGIEFRELRLNKICPAISYHALPFSGTLMHLYYIISVQSCFNNDLIYFQRLFSLEIIEEFLTISVWLDRLHEGFGTPIFRKQVVHNYFNNILIHYIFNSKLCKIKNFYFKSFRLTSNSSPFGVDFFSSILRFNTAS